eukprot:TRINITY_DN2879_c0_g2_i1.p1 TRINITY_DN2879_c0_g2~~TRINITY_DN2879_c0_g2_i1.p1  ORF type:complete len:156 (+),score=56.95 TRINITY_DN2879_c0_g2_i1:33-470(+)
MGQEEEDPMVAIDQALQQEDYDQAFLKALSASRVDLVVAVCAKIDPSVLFKANPFPLSSPILLSLIQQLSFDIVSFDSNLVLAWLRDCLLALQPQDPIIHQHVAPVLKDLIERVKVQSERISDPGVSMMAQLVTHIARSHLFQSG